MHENAQQALARVIERARLLAGQDSEVLAEPDVFLRALLIARQDPSRRGILRAMARTGAKVRPTRTAPDMPEC